MPICFIFHNFIRRFCSFSDNCPKLPNIFFAQLTALLYGCTSKCSFQKIKQAKYSASVHLCLISKGKHYTKRLFSAFRRTSLLYLACPIFSPAVIAYSPASNIEFDPIPMFFHSLVLSYRNFVFLNKNQLSC